MDSPMRLITGCIALLTISGAAQAQSTVTTNGGTTGAVPKFSGGATLANSVITESNGNVGIGTMNPGSQLHIYGSGNQVITLQSTTLGFPGINFANTVGGYTNQLDAINGSLYWFNGSVRNMTLLQNGYLGIGTTNPQAMLDVAGVVNGRNFSIPGVGGTPTWAKIGTFTAAQGGESIRITAFIHNGYNAANSQDSTYVISFKTSNGSSVDGNGFAANSSWYAIGFNGAIPPGNIKWVANAPGVNASAYDLYINLPLWTPGSHYAVSVDQNSSWTNLGMLVAGDPGPASNTILIPNAEFNLPYGNMGIGTTTPGAKLEVAGTVKLSGAGSFITFPDGSVQSTAWNGTLCGGDYAESVDVTGARAQYQPGDVLVIDSSHPGNFLKSHTAYSRLVAGIYSTKPGLVGRRQLTDPKLTSTEVPMAMVGIVPTKVTAENGPIEVGDLLVTSSLLAHAMKGSDGATPTGTVIGKALGALATGTGVIEVLVSLQ